ncbi:hypothetical protein BRARA_A00802 [Brassica rapa]|uniref:Knottin scorpion toxin-like domain-containing protein n=4 Tax=Brassica TaxID=3705 RepID=A0A398AMF7_BRACM|nr:hypothetical protein IGI04_000761 [Brassica rapa subsp. trilocularis]RID77934.1 hypothetical protein BRARA_A00802 [Brassica rapa]CAF2148009.1 unnamed protein product [Brassica napus]CAG7886795.1 unnamed protein product [Brassica rapa]CDY48609.1 BnaA01g07560D [Brassica napus]
MAKLSCSFIFLFMFVFSVFAVAQETKRYQLCTIVIEEQNYCEIADCGIECRIEYNGVGKCLTNSKAGGRLSCFCTYNC